MRSLMVINRQITPKIMLKELILYISKLELHLCNLIPFLFKIIFPYI